MGNHRKRIPKTTTGNSTNDCGSEIKMSSKIEQDILRTAKELTAEGLPAFKAETIARKLEGVTPQEVSPRLSVLAGRDSNNLVKHEVDGEPKRGWYTVKGEEARTVSIGGVTRQIHDDPSYKGDEVVSEEISDTFSKAEDEPNTDSEFEFIVNYLINHGIVTVATVEAVSEVWEAGNKFRSTLKS
jgi:hypothetical protein